MASNKSVIIRIEGNSKALRDEFDRVKKSTENLEKDLNNIAKGSGIAFAGLATTVGLTVKSFATYEQGLLGVGKTADLTGKELTGFGKDIQKLSTQLPFATKELLDIAQSAGQLGVKGRDNLIKFTETIAKLGTASDLSGEEAATALTRILNVTNENIGSIDKFASVIVSLGNNFAATESEIARVTTEVARSTSVFNVSAAEAAALGAALRSVGIQAEGGGSAVGRAFRAIDASIRQGGEAFTDLQKITGLTGDQLRKTFKEDAVGVFQKFTEGLGTVQKSGGDVTAALERFGLKGDEILKVLPVLAGNSELLGRALNIAAKETENATALQKEFEVQAKSLNAEAAKLRNTIGAISEQIGGFFSPTVKNATKTVREFLEKFLDLNDGTKETIATILGIVTAMTGITAAIATAGIAVLGITAGLTALGIAAGPVIAGFLAITAVTAGILTNLDALGATVTGIQAGFTVLVSNIIIGFNNARIATNELLIKMKELGVATLEAVPSDIFNGRIKAMKENIEELKATNEELIQNNKDVGLSFAEVYDQIDAEKMREKLLEEGQAAREAREQNKVAEFERQAQENEEKLIQEGEYNNLFLEQKKGFEAAQTQIELFEQILREEQEKKFNNKKIAILKKNIEDLKKIRDKGLSDEQKADLIHKKNLLDADFSQKKQREQFQEDFRKNILQSVISSGKQLFKEGTGAAKALFLVEKAAAFADNIVLTQKAAAKAAAATAPFSAPFVAAEYAAGALRAAAITGSAIQGFESGGIVGNVFGARTGDRIPTVLSDGEIVAPRKNFDEVIEAMARQRGFVPREETTSQGGGVAQIEISFTDEAAEFITARQLENTTLGTDRSS